MFWAVADLVFRHEYTSPVKLDKPDARLIFWDKITQRNLAGVKLKNVEQNVIQQVRREMNTVAIVERILWLISQAQ